MFGSITEGESIIDMESPALWPVPVAGAPHRGSPESGDMGQMHTRPCCLAETGFLYLTI